jgi:hypothetical protein
MVTRAAPVELHPADQAHVQRIARVLDRLHAKPGFEPECDHGRRPGECGHCLGLRHAEENSTAVRVAFSLGEWPPEAVAA